MRRKGKMAARRAKWEQGCYVFKKYSNRRLYDAQRRGYCTNIDVMNRIKEGRKARVYTNQGDRDITRETLLSVLGRLELSVPPKLVQIDAERLHAYIAATAANLPKSAEAA